MGWLEDSNEYLNYSEAEIEKKLLEKKDEMDKLMKEDIKNSLIEEVKEENNPSEEDIKKMEEYIEENYEELVPEQYVVRGATLKCSCGSHERKLDMLKDHAVYVEGFPMVHELDKELEENIKYFGVCSSGSPVLKSENVKLVKIVYDEEGNPIEQVVKGTKCIPHIIGNWRDTKEDVRIVDNGDKDGFDKFRNAEDENKGYRAVTTKSFLICRHGGIIEPLDSGQVMIESEENNRENTEIEETENESLLEDAIPFVAGMGGGLVENSINTFSKKKGRKYKIKKNRFKIKNLKIYYKNNKIQKKSGARNIKFENKNGVDLSDMTGPQAIEYDELAENMYEKIRNSNDDDIKKISKNMNWDEDKIKLIKEHVFIKKHLFEDGDIRRFDPDFWQASTWERMITGDIGKYDELFLNHEFYELNYMKKFNSTYEEAHKEANKLYNWEKNFFK